MCNIWPDFSFSAGHPLVGSVGGSGVSHSSSPMDVIDSLTTVGQHKAKIMYYYETLSSADYRGSMTSLQSCQSAFSNASSTKFSKVLLQWN